jgi:hypothetical protein
VEISLKGRLFCQEWLGKHTLAQSYSTSVPFEWCDWNMKFPQGLQVPLLILLEFGKLEQEVFLCQEKLSKVGGLSILKAWNWSGRL